MSEPREHVGTRLEDEPEEPIQRIPPVALPIVALLATLILVFSASRIFLAVSKGMAAVIALFLALNVLVGAALVSVGRRVRGRPAAFPFLLMAGILVVAGGAMAMALGGGEEGEHGAEPQLATVRVAAQDIAFDPAELSAPAGEEFAIEFQNRDEGVDHNVAIFAGADATAENVFRGEIFPGVATEMYSVPALDAGEYFFHCDVHPNMTGTIVAEEGGGQPAEDGTGELTETETTPTASPTTTEDPTEGTGGEETAADLTAVNIAFDPVELTLAPEGGQLTFTFANEDDGVPHNVAVFDGPDENAPRLFAGEIITGPDQIEYSFEAPDPGEYFFWCDVHPNMTGTIRVE